METMGALTENIEGPDFSLLEYLLDSEVSIQDHFYTLAKEFAYIDKLYHPLKNTAKLEDEFYSLLIQNKFIPTPACLIHGTENYSILFQDMALKVNDNFDDIFDKLKLVSHHLQNGIKIGVDFSDLRAKRSLVKSSHLQSVGPIRFMELYAKAPQQDLEKLTELKFKLNIDHLDIEEFLEFISSNSDKHVHYLIGITEKFLNSVQNSGSYELFHQPGSASSRLVKAESILNRIFELIHDGHKIDLVFHDNLDDFCIQRGLSPQFSMSFRNQFLEPEELYASGYINLKSFYSNGELQLDQLEKAIQLAVHFLDNSFEKNFYISETSKNITKRNRRVILGVLGLDYFLEREAQSESPKAARKAINKVLKIFHENSLKMSSHLGHQRGANHQIRFNQKLYSVRNCQLLGQVHIPLAFQISEANSLLGSIDASDKLKLSQTISHFSLWQNHLTNLISYKVSLPDRELEKIQSLFWTYHTNHMYMFELL